MEEYLVCEMNLVYGNQLKKARRLTEEEKNSLYAVVQRNRICRNWRQCKLGIS